MFQFLIINTELDTIASRIRILYKTSGILKTSEVYTFLINPAPFFIFCLVRSVQAISSKRSGIRQFYYSVQRRFILPIRYGIDIKSDGSHAADVGMDAEGLQYIGEGKLKCAVLFS